MFTIAFGLRFTSRRASYEGWLSLFFVHILLKMTTKDLDYREALPPLVVETKQEKKTTDPVKRRSLQPGSRMYKNSNRSNFVLPPAMDKFIQEPSNKHKVRQPGPVTEALSIPLQSVYHKFYGSQITVGGVTIARGLGNSMHRLEVTAGNQLFVDNVPFPANPTDIERIRIELIKAQSV